MTPEHTDMTGAARLREALENADRAARKVDAFFGGRKVLGDDAATALLSLHDFLNDFLNNVQIALNDVQIARDALAAVPEAPEPGDALAARVEELEARIARAVEVIGRAPSYATRREALRILRGEDE